MRVTVPSFVMGKVSGFLIVRNKTERLEFQTAEEMMAEIDRIREIERAVWARVGKRAATGAELDAAGGKDIPSDEYFTLMRRDDNGVIEQEPGADVMKKNPGQWPGERTKVGDIFIKKFCKICGGEPVWFQMREGYETAPFECETCVDKEIDGDHYDGGLEREY
jgi:hypothetical protein